ncbi:MAG: hypothetical protein OXG77_02225 [Chloroflexi bacterium]|nr:hypothetical protein [Chloroflexota bacterium]MXY13543.1 hypothetical protein [Chloroflexota bacterium]
MPERIRRCSEEADAILKVAVEKGNDILRDRDRNGSIIRVADVQFLGPGDESRKSALWTAALGELESLGYAWPASTERGVFRITGRGRNYVAKITRAGSLGA